MYLLLLSRADLLGLYEQVILNDIEYSDSQSVDQALWKNVFYQVIERFRQLLKESAYDNTSHIRNMLLTLLDEVKRLWKLSLSWCWQCKGMINEYNKSISEKLCIRSVLLVVLVQY